MESSCLNRVGFPHRVGIIISVSVYSIAEFFTKASTIMADTVDDDFEKRFPARLTVLAGLSGMELFTKEIALPKKPESGPRKWPTFFDLVPSESGKTLQAAWLRSLKTRLNKIINLHPFNEASLIPNSVSSAEETGARITEPLKIFHSVEDSDEDDDSRCPNEHITLLGLEIAFADSRAGLQLRQYNSLLDFEVEDYLGDSADNWCFDLGDIVYDIHTEADGTASNIRTGARTGDFLETSNIRTGDFLEKYLLVDNRSRIDFNVEDRPAPVDVLRVIQDVAACIAQEQDAALAEVLQESEYSDDDRRAARLLLALAAESEQLCFYLDTVPDKSRPLSKDEGPRDVLDDVCDPAYIELHNLDAEGPLEFRLFLVERNAAANAEHGGS